MDENPLEWTCLFINKYFLWVLTFRDDEIFWLYFCWSSIFTYLEGYCITAVAVCRMLVRLLVAKFSSIDVGN